MLILFEIQDESTISTIMCGHLKFHYENLISHFVIHDQIWYASQDLHPKFQSSNDNIWKYNVTRMSVPTRWTWLDLLIRAAPPHHHHHHHPPTQLQSVKPITDSPAPWWWTVQQTWAVSTQGAKHVFISLQWHHNECHSVSSHQQLDGLFHYLS